MGVKEAETRDSAKCKMGMHYKDHIAMLIVIAFSIPEVVTTVVRGIVLRLA